jgi:hypothetical protein
MAKNNWFKSAKDNEQYAEEVNAAVDAYRRGEISEQQVMAAYEKAATEHVAYEQD